MNIWMLCGLLLISWLVDRWSHSFPSMKFCVWIQFDCITRVCVSMLKYCSSFLRTAACVVNRAFFGSKRKRIDQSFQHECENNLWLNVDFIVLEWLLLFTLYTYMDIYIYILINGAIEDYLKQQQQQQEQKVLAHYIITL